jgi:hypothetical protein
MLGDAANWVLSGATLALVGVTAVLAYAAVRALGQLQTALQDLEEVKRDRHVQVFADWGRRWQSAEMIAALQLEAEYTPQQLAELFSRGGDATEPPKSPLGRRRRRREAKARVVMLGVPNYFEDAVITARAGGLDEALFAENFGGLAIAEWARWGLAIIEIRRVNDDLAYVEFERFALAMEAQDDARHRAASEASKAS